MNEDREQLIKDAKEALNPGSINAAQRIELFPRILAHLIECKNALDHWEKGKEQTQQARFRLVTKIRELQSLVWLARNRLGQWDLGSEFSEKFNSILKEIRECLNEIYRGSSE